MTTEYNEMGYELPESLDAYRARITRDRQLRAEAFDRARERREMNVLAIVAFDRARKHQEMNILTIIACVVGALVVGALALVWPGARL